MMVIEQIGVPRIPTPALHVSAGAPSLSAYAVRFIGIMFCLALIALAVVGYRKWRIEEDKRVSRQQYAN